MSPVLTIIGATGAQGGSVVKSALIEGTYQVRAVTRNANSEKAKALAARGVEVVTADVNDEQSLIRAFIGSTAIFAITDFFEPFAAGGREHAVKVETQQGINLAKAAAATTTLKHYIWSTLPNPKRLSKGKYILPHFEAKNQVDDFIKNDSALLAKTTFLWVTFYAANYLFPMFTPNFTKSSGKYVQLQPVPRDVPIFSVGDATKNVGTFALSILQQPELTLGKFVRADVEKTTVGDMLDTWTKATGKPSVYVQTATLNDFDAVWPLWGQEMGSMMQFWQEAGDDSWTGEEGILTRNDLNIKEKLVGVEEAFASLDWSSL